MDAAQKDKEEENGIGVGNHRKPKQPSVTMGSAYRAIEDIVDNIQIVDDDIDDKKTIDSEGTGIDPKDPGIEATV